MRVAETAKTQFYFRIDAAFRQWLLLPKAGQDTDETKKLCTQWRETAYSIALAQGQKLVSEASEAAFLGRWIKNEGKTETTTHYSSAEAFNRFIRTINKIRKGV